jgi:hypothetical protein
MVKRLYLRKKIIVFKIACLINRNRAFNQCGIIGVLWNVCRGGPQCKYVNMAAKDPARRTGLRLIARRQSVLLTRVKEMALYLRVFDITCMPRAPIVKALTDVRTGTGKTKSFTIKTFCPPQRIVIMKPIDTIAFTDSDTYCSEEYFERILILERKRSRRSGRPFMLVLLNIGKLLEGKRNEKKVVLEKLGSVLDSSTRGIDIKGWYLQDSIIGIICQDVHMKDRDSVTGKLGDNLVKCRYLALNTKKSDPIKMLRLFCPDPQEKLHSAL